MEEITIDPTAVLGDDLMCQILALLPPTQLLKCARVSTAWHRAATLQALWEGVCRARWEGKVYVPAAARDDLSWKQKYLLAEAQRRAGAAFISLAELTAFTWRFRFKRTAGSWFMENDPYWVHGKDEARAMRRRFRPDGRFEAPVPRADPFSPYPGDDGEDEPMVWRFVDDRGAPAPGADGSAGVQVNHYPPLSVRRRTDWGFVMENVWVELVADLHPGGPFQAGIPAQSEAAGSGSTG